MSFEFPDRSFSDSYYGRETFHHSSMQETTNPPRSSPIFSVEPCLSSTTSHINAVTAPGPGIIPPDNDSFFARSHQNFQGNPFIDYGTLRHDDFSLPGEAGTIVSTIPISQTTDGAWSTSASATPRPELESSAHNSSTLTHSPPSHVVASSSFMWSVHGPVHTETVRSLLGREVLHEDHRTAMLQGSPPSLAQVPPTISWCPQGEAVGSSATAVFQYPSLQSRPTPSTLRHGSALRCTVSRQDETARMSPQTAGTGPASYEPASQSPLQRRRASWSSYADRPTKALRCNGFVLDEEDVREARNINGGIVVAYLCRWTHNGQECGMHVMGDRTRFARHIQRWHRTHVAQSQKQVPCRWGGCGKEMKRENVVRHLIVTHLKMKWRCSVCRTKLSRDDASARHFERVKSCRHGVATVERGPEAQEVNVCEGVEF